MTATPLGLDLPLRALHNGNGAKAVATPPGATASGVNRIESKGSGVQFFGASTGRIVHLLGGVPIDYEGFDLTSVRGRTAYAASALAYLCIRYRATKIIEAPLRVFEEQDSGGWERLKDHPLDQLLRKPNPDYGMKRHIEATEVYLCTTGMALWVKNRNRGRQVDSMYCFSGDDFHIERDKERKRLFGEFHINGYTEPFKPEDVVLFQYFHPTDPFRGLAPLDAALSHLNIGQTLLHRARHAVKNAFGAGAIYTPDKEWHPTDEEFTRAKSELNTMFQGANTGKTAIAEGGGQFHQGFNLQQIMLGELWRLVEVGVSGTLGVPAPLVGTLVGLENSPWSHLKTAVDQFYDATIFPEWEFISEPITDQLLRDVDEDPSHMVGFEWKDVRALQKDRANEALIVSSVQRMTSLNERRAMLGLEIIDDEAADEIPELNQPDLSQLFGGAPADDEEEEEPTEEETEEEKRRETKARTLRQFLFDSVTQSIEGITTLAAAQQFDRDRTAIALLMEAAEPKAADVSLETKDAARQRINRAKDAIEDYLKTRSRTEWTAQMSPLLQAGAVRAGSFISADLSIDQSLLNADLLEYAEREVAWLVRQVADTTRDSIRAAVRDGIGAGEGAAEIARRLRELPAFNRERAMLVARTESTRVANGAPQEALSSFGKRTGTAFTKTWSAVLDVRTRDEHWDMDGETVGIDKAFSNGLQAPGEPNCRCTLLYGVEA